MLACLREVPSDRPTAREVELVLRSQPSVPQRMWLIVGIAAAQFLAIGLPVPMLLWEPVWIGLLGLEPWLRRRDQAVPNSLTVTPSSLSAEKSG